MVILVFFLVISVNRRSFRYFGSYSGISVIPVILVNRRTGRIQLPPSPVTVLFATIQELPVRAARYMLFTVTEETFQAFNDSFVKISKRQSIAQIFRF